MCYILCDGGLSVVSKSYTMLTHCRGLHPLLGHEFIPRTYATVDNGKTVLVYLPLFDRRFPDPVL